MRTAMRTRIAVVKDVYDYMKVLTLAVRSPLCTTRVSLVTSVRRVQHVERCTVVAHLSGVCVWTQTIVVRKTMCAGRWMDLHTIDVCPILQTCSQYNGRQCLCLQSFQLLDFAVVTIYDEQYYFYTILMTQTAFSNYRNSIGMRCY